MPCTPMETSLSRTSSSLNGLMTAMTSFMTLSLTSCGLRRDDARCPGGEARHNTKNSADSLPEGRDLPTSPQQAFLADRGDKRAVARENETAGEAARAGKIGAVLGEEEPRVGTKRTVKPQRVIEACGHDLLLE